MAFSGSFLGVSAVAKKGKRWLKRAAQLLACSFFSLVLLGCVNRAQPVRLIEMPDVPSGGEVRKLIRSRSGDLSEVAPPAVFLDLDALIEQTASAKQPAGAPQVVVAAPKPDQVIDTTTLNVKLKLRGLSIYKDDALGLGPHLQVILDNQPAQTVYDLNAPLVLSDLAPGSHTLRVLAVKPWGESFKNEAAYTQTTFHVFAKTGENTPNPNQPVLTYSEPQGTYGAEPILLDFHLSNAPLHRIAASDPTLTDWRIRCDVNGQSFVFDQWQPIYLKGFKRGQNWVQLTLIDEQGNPIDNTFNSTVRVINYAPNQRDTLAKITRGELPLGQVGQIVDPQYEPPIEEPPIEELPIEEPTVIKKPVEALPIEEKPVESLLENLDTTQLPTTDKTSAPAIPAPTLKQPATNLFDSNQLPEQEKDAPITPEVPTEKTRQEDASVIELEQPFIQKEPKEQPKNEFKDESEKESLTPLVPSTDSEKLNSQRPRASQSFSTEFQTFEDFQEEADSSSAQNTNQESERSIRSPLDIEQTIPTPNPEIERRVEKDGLEAIKESPEENATRKKIETKEQEPKNQPTNIPASDPVETTTVQIEGEKSPSLQERLQTLWQKVTQSGTEATAPVITPVITPADLTDTPSVLPNGASTDGTATESSTDRSTPIPTQEPATSGPILDSSIPKKSDLPTVLTAPDSDSFSTDIEPGSTESQPTKLDSMELELAPQRTAPKTTTETAP